MSKQQLLDRIKDPALRVAAASCLKISDQFQAEKDGHSRDGKLTAAGMRDATHTALPDVLRKWTTAQRPIEKAAYALKAKRDAIRIPERAHDDVAGAINDWEIRSMVSRLDPLQRNSLLMATNDPRLLGAVVSAPPELSSLVGPGSAEVVTQVREKYLELLHGDALREINESESDIAEAVAAAQVARNAIASTADLDARQFEQIAGPIQKGASAPWLIKSDNAVLVCEVNEEGVASYHQASPWEVENGIFYKDKSEYDASRGQG